MLKEKICRLFSFSSDVVFTMTYVDEDGDVVILATDDDLRDIGRQSLDPLRITVNLSNGTPAESSVGTWDYFDTRDINTIPASVNLSNAPTFGDDRSLPKPLTTIFLAFGDNCSSPKGSNAVVIMSIVSGLYIMNFYNKTTT
ncbi:Phox/Bem1p [Artemisia annua]|uniref:Phox/Bem1p n=1 Tax=Artemisia annua TaxID=35608 RepID=A0A2U1LW54_ARTAN|nr:Phox/Bem1p [Artemisia annua]